MKELLYRNNDFAKTSRVIRDLWFLKRNVLKKQKENKQHLEDNQTSQNMQKLKKNPPMSGLPQNRVPNPPQSGPPQSGLPQSRTIESLQDSQDLELENPL